MRVSDCPISVYLCAPVCRHNALGRRKIEQCGEKIEEKHKWAKNKGISWCISHTVYELEGSELYYMCVYTRYSKRMGPLYDFQKYAFSGKMIWVKVIRIIKDYLLVTSNLTLTLRVNIKFLNETLFFDPGFEKSEKFYVQIRCHVSDQSDL